MHVSESIPLGFRPTTVNQSAVFAMPTERMALLVNPDGSVTALGNPGSAYACCSGCWVTSDKWPAWATKQTCPLKSPDDLLVQ